MRGKHEVHAIDFDHSRGFIILGEQMGRGGDAKVV